MNMMRKLLGLLFLASLICESRAADVITATVTVTAGTTNGQTITVNSNVRTWTNSVVVPATQILTNSTIGGAATNLYLQVAGNPFTGLSLARSGTTGITLQTAPGGALSVSLSAGWGTVVLSTNSTTSAVVVRVPYTVEGAAQQTNITSGIVTMVGAAQNTNVLYESAPAMVNFVGRTNAQSVGGNKTYTGTNVYSNAASIFYLGTISNAAGISGTLNSVTNGSLWSPGLSSPNLTNAINRGNPFSSPGNSTLSEQFGSGASASAIGALAVGAQALALGFTSAAVGNNAVAAGSTSTAMGTSAAATNANSTAVGNTAIANAANSTALGASSTASNANSTAIGYNAHTTAANQVMLGDSGSGIDTWVSGNLTVVGNQTNLHAMGTNTFAAGADISFGRYALSSLANGINQDIVVGTNVFVEVSGPTGAFSIEGIAGGRDGKLVFILNQTGQNMTIATEGGATGNDPTAANRIISLSGADRATTGNGAAMLLYSGASSRWILMSFEP